MIQTKGTAYTFKRIKIECEKGVAFIMRLRG